MIQMRFFFRYMKITLHYTLHEHFVITIIMMMIIISINHFFYALLVVQYDLCWMSFPIKKKWIIRGEFDLICRVWFNHIMMMMIIQRSGTTTTLYFGDYKIFVHPFRASNFRFWMEKKDGSTKRWNLIHDD